MERAERDRLFLSGEWRDWVVREAKSWLRTPYLHKARIKGVGVDCGGLVYEVYNPLLGPFPPFPRDYNPDWGLHRTEEIYLNFLGPFVQKVFAPQPGGLALFHAGRAWSHGAIVTNSQTFIHAWGSHTSGYVKEDGPRAFNLKGGKPRAALYFDVSTQWLSSLSQP